MSDAKLVAVRRAAARVARAEAATVAANAELAVALRAASDDHTVRALAEVAGVSRSQAHRMIQQEATA
jgi:hypothetical protein